MKKSQKSVNYFQFIINYHIILLIPMLIVSLSVFYLAKNQLFDRMKNEIRITSESQADYWQQQLSVISSYNSDCRYSKLYSEIKSREYPTSYLEIKDDLKQKESVFPFIDRLYFYDTAEKKVFSSSGIINEAQFFTFQCKLEAGLLAKARKAKQAVGRGVFSQGNTNGVVFVYLLRDDFPSTGEEGQYLIYTVRDDKLREQFSPRIKGAITGLTYLGTTIYSNTGEALSQNGRMETFSLPLNSGFSILNMVPKKEVLRNALAYIQGYAIWILCSLLIGIALAIYYSSKRYAAFQNLINHNLSLQEERNELRAESCLYALLTEDVKQGDELWQECLNSGVRIDRTYKYIAVFPEGKENQGLKKHFTDMAVHNPVATAYRIRIFSGMYIYLVCTKGPKNQLLQELSKFKDNGARFERSGIITDAGKLKDSYEAVMKRVRKTQGQYGDYPKMELEALKEAAALGDDSRTKVILRELGQIAAEAPEVTAVLMGFEALQIMGLNVQCFYALARKGALSRQDVMKSFEQELKNWKPTETKNDLAEEGQRKKSIADILSWLHQHYLDDNFTAKYMAGHFDTSVSNLSHFFKKNVGVTISQYVEQIKLDKAKELLTSSDRKVSEIAQILHYGNSSAFIAMFKKQEGMTPKKYRESCTTSFLHEV